MAYLGAHDVLAHVNRVRKFQRLLLDRPTAKEIIEGCRKRRACGRKDASGLTRNEGSDRRRARRGRLDQPAAGTAGTRQGANRQNAREASVNAQRVLPGSACCSFRTEGANEVDDVPQVLIRDFAFERDHHEIRADAGGDGAEDIHVGGPMIPRRVCKIGRL